MRYLIMALLMAGTCPVLQAQTKKSSKSSVATLKPTTPPKGKTPVTKVDKLSYAFGYNFGNDLKRNNIEVNPEFFSQGLKEMLLNLPKAMEEKDVIQILNDFQAEMQAKMKKEPNPEAEANKKAGRDFLAENKKRQGVVELPSGLQYEIITEGAGESPKAEDKVTTHYTGKLLDGKVFDSSVERGQPLQFPVNGVIKGWTEALQLMKPGAKWKLYIPADLAYGDGGAPPNIPPGATLIFDVELISVDK